METGALKCGRTVVAANASLAVSACWFGGGERRHTGGLVGKEGSVGAALGPVHTRKDRGWRICD